MRMRATWGKVLGICLLAGLTLVPQILAQNPTGTVTGRVTDKDGGTLPGVTVTATSANLQGTRTTQTGANGDYKLGILPPGEYKLTYELEGFATAVKNVKVSAAQSVVADVTMQLSEVVEEIVVTSNYETISETQTVASTYTKEEVESLPVNRTIVESVALAPGVHQTGPKGAGVRDGNVSISGAMSFENLWLINGVVINENVRGQSLPLFIEDAVQETTTATAGISSEYGRFSGGVVNVITKSGGNDFSGSLRASFGNDDWTNTTALEDARSLTPTDVTNKTYEATLGGPFWRDKLWFFLAARNADLSGSSTTVAPTSIQFPTSSEEDRLEAKLTLAITPSHSLVGSYLDIDSARSGNVFQSVLDLRSVTSRMDPQQITSGNYTGILSSSFFVEAQYSEREFQIGIGSGGPQDLINGTLFRELSTSNRFWSPTFCGFCETEERNNENALAKGSYFLTSEAAGTHDITFGYDTFTDIRFSVNHQSGSDFQVWSESIVINANDPNTIYPVLPGGAGDSSWVVWWPPVGLDQLRPTDFVTDSFYVNDSWQLNENWSFNLGVRYDVNDGVDSGGNKVAEDSKVSPRLGVSYDVKGDGDLVFNASYGTYVAALANTRGDSTSTGGALAAVFNFYGGDAINVNCQPSGAGCVTTDQAIQTIFDWYTRPIAQGGFGGTTDINQLGTLDPNFLIYTFFPGTTAQIDPAGGIKSPAANELTFGATKRLGNKGLVRADVVWRDWEDFYSDRTSVPPASGVVQTPSGAADLLTVGNFGDDFLSREYIGLNLQARYRVTDKLTLSGNYTWSDTEGNIDGESSGGGPGSVDPLNQPEYKDPRWNIPEGRLNTHQKHKFRTWAIYDIIDNERHSLNASVLFNFFSGTPYGAVGSVNTSDNLPAGSQVPNPGYAQPPASVTYYFTDRDAFYTDDVTRTDISVNYAFRWKLFGKSIEVFLQPEVINIFDEDSVIDVNMAIFDQTNTGRTSCPLAGPGGTPGRCLSFNPFTETPVQGVHWQPRPTGTGTSAGFGGFGEPQEKEDFQQPLTYRFSVGFRF